MVEAQSHCLLTIEEMERAEAATIASGFSSEKLMEAAGKAVADAIIAHGGRRVSVLCGPGNNGGDGFVAARYLVDAGFEVRLGLLGQIEQLKGDAKINAERWSEKIEPLSPDVLGGADCVIDAIFGAGLSRRIDGQVFETIAAIGDRYCISVDMPSGVHGDTGEVMAIAPKAQKTVTFFRLKPGHLLFPGRAHCGETEVVDIGISDTVLAEIQPKHWRNHPKAWPVQYPWPSAGHHKYSRGHAVIVAGHEMTGAACLAVSSAMRVGAGIVSVATPTEAAVIYRICLPGAIIHPIRDTGMFREIIEDPRVSACLVGPGNGVNVATREKVLAVLRQKMPVVLDADAISVFEETPNLLFSSIDSPCLLTPHEGEFLRIFNSSGDKVSRVRDAAIMSGATVILKGADTVIGAPDGRIVINENAPPDLATAGAGDVLAGFAVGLISNKLDPFAAGCIAVWLHGEVAQVFGPGLIAEDLPDVLPSVLKDLKKMESVDL